MKRENKLYNSPQLLASLPKDTPVLVAFSGGADSSALLHLLANDAKANGYTIHAAHFNHQIRGNEAERDAKFCQTICASLNIPFHLGFADIPSLAKESGNSIEAEARERRYAFFEKIMRENNIPILVTAHHAEDQIESIMLHLLRGSGISGLCGMSPCRTFSKEFFLVRPLLCAQKEDILSYCAKNNIEFVTDSSNADVSYARNFIRAELTPKMRELQQNLSGVFDRLSESAYEANDFIECEAVKFIENECDSSIPLKKFNELHSALKSRVLILAFEKYSGGCSLEYTHIKSIIELSKKAEAHSSISLPCTTTVKIENDCLVFGEDKKINEDEDFSIPFTLGETTMPNGITINIEKNPLHKATDSDLFLNVKCDIIKNDAHFRSKKEGDVILAGKINKKVKKLINEKKIPLNMRKRIPILVCENEILWIPTVAVCDDVKREKIKSGDDFYRITIKL